MKFSPFNNKSATPPAADPPAPETPPPAPVKRVPWTAVAARPHNSAKRNQGEAYLAARAAKEASSGNSSAARSLHREVSQASLAQKDFTSNISLSTFPTVPQAGVEASTINDKLRNLQRKMSFTKDDASSSKIDLGLTSAENERLTGLPIQQSRSMADLSTLNRAPSDRSLRSLKVSNTSGNSLGEKVGFTFKTTTGFVHPNQKTPSRFATPLNQSEDNSQHTSMAWEDEEDHEAAVERLNSVTGSDGGWQSGWSMNGSNTSFSQEPGMRRPSEATSLARRPSVAPVLEDYAPTENAYTSSSEGIAEEQEREYQDGSSSSHGSFGRAESSDSPVEVHDGEISPASATSFASSESRESRPAPLRINTRRSLAESALFSNPPTFGNNQPTTPTRGSQTNFSYPTSPIYASSDRAASVVSRDLEPEDPLERAASIATARKAFEEKEAAKEIKYQRNQAASEERRRRRSEAAQSMHARIWRRESTSRRPSIAMVDSFEDEEVDGFPSAHVQLSRKTSDAVVHTRKPSDSRKASDARDHSRKPSESRRKSSDTQGHSRSGSGSSMFSNVDYSGSKSAEAERESAFFPPYEIEEKSSYTYNARKSSHAIPMLSQEEPAGLWPPPSTGAVYNIAGKLYDEYGMSVSHFGEEDATPRSQSASKAKGKPKDKFIKFSAWSKTRLLRA